MKNKIILILVLVSFFGFGQDTNFNNNRYFKLTNHYKNKQELFLKGYSKFDLQIEHFFNDEELNNFKKKFPKFKNYDGFNMAPNNKNLLGFKFVKEDANVNIDSICFCDTNGTIYNSFKLDCVGETSFLDFYTLNSKYVYFSIFSPCNKVYIYKNDGKKLYEINNLVQQYKNKLFLSIDTKSFLIMKNNEISFYKDDKSLIWEIKIKEDYVLKSIVYSNIIIVYSDVSLKHQNKMNNNRKITIINKNDGNILFNKKNIERAFFYNDKFLINKKINNRNEYYEYKILD